MLQDSKWRFLASTRFWALVIGSLAVVANGGFTIQSWTEGIITLVAGFATIRTIDRVSDKKVEAAEASAGTIE